jgi:pre-rRNA-processing protein IPI3
MASAPLTELLLSSTTASSPLPTVSLHNPLTGALVYSFRSPVASTSTAAAKTGKEDKDAQSLDHRRTFAAVEAKDGCGGFLMGLGGKEGRSGLNVWSFTRVRCVSGILEGARSASSTRRKRRSIA